MRVVVVADSHFDEHSRFGECIRLHREIEAWVTEHKPDLLCHAGDVFEGTSTPREREMVAEWLQDVAQTCPVVLVRGNHDKAIDIEFMERLKSRRQIHAFERPAVARVSGLQIACLPWPKKAELLAAIGNVPQEQAGAVAQDALRSVLRGLREETDTSLPCLFLGHVMVRGSVTSHGQPLVGMDMELGLEDLALVGADAYALGHIHMRQDWKIDGAPVVYPGSPRRTAFGELERKGFYVIDFSLQPEGGWIASTEFVALSATPMLLVESEWVANHYGIDGARPDGFADIDAPDASVVGAEIRFRYHVAAEHREAARAAAEAIRDRWISLGAVSVKLEAEVEAETRMRAPEVAKASTLADQLEAYWWSVRFDPGARRGALLGKLAQLESEVVS